MNFFYNKTFTMKNLFLLSTLCFLLIFNSCQTESNPIVAVATITAKSNSNVTGSVKFTEVDGTVTMVATISNLTQGDHAIHIHAEGDCSASDGSSAGGHWNPTNVDHGKWGQGNFHIGDIGNITPNGTGVGTIERTTNLWCIGCGDTNKNILGKAIIIHAGPDDFSSQPSGAAGARIGCGEIIKQ